MTKWGAGGTGFSWETPSNAKGCRGSILPPPKLQERDRFGCSGDKAELPVWSRGAVWQRGRGLCHQEAAESRQ